MLPDAAVESTGALAGKFEVVGSVYKVHRDKEYEPRPGQTVRDNPKVTALVWKVTPISDDGDKLEDADTRDIVLKMGGKSLATFHPGKGSAPDDMEPDDLGDELNTEGNTLYISGGNVEMSAKSGYTVMMKSLQHRGFPKDKIAECWAPNFKGLKFELITVTPDKLEAFGQKKGDANQAGENITYKVCQAIIAMPGAGAGGKKGKAEKTEKSEKGTKSEKSETKKETEPSGDDAGSGNGSSNNAEAEAIRVLTATAKFLSGKNKKLDQARTFWITTFTDPKTKGNPKLKDEARKLVNSDKWLIEQLEELGCLIDKDERTVQFSEVEA